MLEVQRTSDTMEPRYIETTKRILQLNEWFSLQCYYKRYALRPQYFRSPLVHFMRSWARCILWRRNKEEKCDVTLPWWQNFSISAIFLDRNGHLRCRTMEEKFGLLFCSECNHAQESHTCQCCPRICGTTVCWGPDIVLPWQRDVTTSPLCRPFARWRHFTTTTRILFFFPLIFKFCNPSEVWITKALISTRKQNPEGFWS